MGPEAIHHGCVGNDICITQFNQFDAMKYRVSCRVPPVAQQTIVINAKHFPASTILPTSQSLVSSIFPKKPTLTTKIVINLRPRVLEKLGSSKRSRRFHAWTAEYTVAKCAFTFYLNSSNDPMVDVIGKRNNIGQVCGKANHETISCGRSLPSLSQ